MKNEIIILFPYKFNQNHFFRLELDQLKQDHKVVVWEFGRFLAPAFFEAVDSKPVVDIEIVQIRDIISLFQRLFQQDFETVALLINEIKPHASLSPARFRINLVFLIVHFIPVAILNTYNTNLPRVFPAAPSIASLDRSKRIQTFLRKSAFSASSITQSVLKKFVVFCLKRTSKARYVLFAGNDRSCQEGLQFGNFFTSFCQPLFGHPWDISNLGVRRIPGPESARLLSTNYVVYVDGAGPKFADDRFAPGIKQEYKLTEKNWYGRLRRIFSILESSMNVKVIVAAHPKSNWKSKYPPEFGGRPVVYDQTLELIANCSFALMRASTSAIVAKHFRKPILYLVSDELRLTARAMQTIVAFQRHYGGSIVDMEGSEEEILSKIPFTRSVEDSGSVAYSGTGDIIPNSTIIARLINQGFE